ncbi:hypothetical protein AAVH_26502 [Aphelenchoides avenae]|nr:hypothetical protein AAVH_26502 [Aphelenchus avenae]
MSSLKTVLFSLSTCALLFTFGVTGSPAEISLTEFDEMCTYFPGALHCPGASLEKSSTDGLMRKFLLQQYLSRLRKERALATA